VVDENEVDLAYLAAGNVPRNTCYPVTAHTNSVWNGTNTRWYLFHTAACNGSHAEIAPYSYRPLPVGYDSGQTHAIMRTSSTT
jgi:hypothetical protein